MLEQTKQRLRAIRDEVGYSEYDAAQRSLNRERLENTDRVKRKSISFSVVKRKYQRAKGICWWCQTTMPMVRGQIEGDHFDANAEDFNSDSNIGVLHKNCNREKGPLSLNDQAIYLRITVQELIERFRRCQ